MKSRVINLDLKMTEKGYDVGKCADWVEGDGITPLMPGEFKLANLREVPKKEAVADGQ
jgi:hypothetical protein